MTVARVWEAPRVTLPYTDEQWAAIEALGHRVDADLRAHDVRLTQGGEPTFVSVDDRDGAEWNTEAMGPTKRVLSADLMDKLRAQVRRTAACCTTARASGTRASSCRAGRSTCFWRKDGEPIWYAPRAVRRRARRLRRDRGAGARVPARRRASGSGSTAKYVFPAYEDVWYYLWRERKLPINVDPFDARLADPLERERLRKVFSAGARQGRRPRAAGRARPARAGALADRPVVPARRALLPDPGRLADGLPPAARFAALGRAPATCRGCTRPTRPSRSRRCRRTSACASRDLRR